MSRCSRSMLVTTATRRRELQERAVGLVGLGDHEVALAEARARAEHVEPAADDDRRVEPAAVEDERRPSRWWWSCRGCRPPRRRTSGASARRASRRAGSPGCRGARASTTSGLSARTAVEVTTTCGARRRARRRGPRRRARPSAARRSVDGERLQVGAGDRVAEVQQHLGDAAHAGAADADEVDVLDLAVSTRASALPAGRRRARRASGRAEAPRRLLPSPSSAPACSTSVADRARPATRP